MCEVVECDPGADRIKQCGGGVLRDGGRDDQGEGLRNMAEEVGVHLGGVPITLYTDSTAAKSFGSRRGVGRMRHIETRALWLQEAVNRKEVFKRRYQAKTTRQI